jgi:hypothetical protein
MSKPKLYSIGIDSVDNSMQLIEILKGYNIRALIDVRENTKTNKVGLNKETLGEDCSSNDIIYFNMYDNTLNISYYADHLSNVYLKEGLNVCLFGVKTDPEKCNRFEVSSRMFKRGYDTYHIIGNNLKKHSEILLSKTKGKGEKTLFDL